MYSDSTVVHTVENEGTELPYSAAFIGQGSFRYGLYSTTQ